MTDKVIHLHSRLRRAFREIDPPGIPTEMHAALSAEIRALESQVAMTQATTPAGAMVQLAVALSDRPDFPSQLREWEKGRRAEFDRIMASLPKKGRRHRGAS